jgi:hypothetical protein
MPAEIYGRRSSRIAGVPALVTRVFEQDGLVEQEMIGFIYLLEALLGCAVTRSKIRVILLGQPAISLFYFCRRGSRAKAEDGKIMRGEESALFFLHDGSWRLPLVASCSRKAVRLNSR